MIITKKKDLKFNQNIYDQLFHNIENNLNKVAFSKDATDNDLSKKSVIEGLFSSLKAKMYGKK